MSLVISQGDDFTSDQLDPEDVFHHESMMSLEFVPSLSHTILHPVLPVSHPILSISFSHPPSGVMPVILPGVMP